MKVAGILVIAMWAAFFVNSVTPFDFNNFGVTPRTFSGAVGIIAMPFLHGSLGHIISNTIPIFILICLLGATCKRPVSEVVSELVIMAGGLLWAFGNQATHIGASGVVYALVTYLVMAGVWSKNAQRAVVGFFVAICYSSLIWGVLPTQPGVSWAGHLYGAIGGVVVAYGHFMSGQIEKKSL